MNLNFCRHQCGKSWHPRRIYKTKGNQWYLVMNECYESNNECFHIPIEDASDFIKHPPKGWYKCQDELQFYEGNAEGDLWRIRLLSGDGECPYVAEHLLYDIQHEKKLKDWGNREKKRLALIADRMKKFKEQSDD